MRRYRSNGTPIGFQKPYVVLPGNPPQVWEVDGCKDWDEVKEAVAAEKNSGRFGRSSEKLIIVMPRANMVGAYMSRASLRFANMNEAKLNVSRLEGADLYAASLISARMENSLLNGANLEKANMSGANLRESDLTAANLSFAIASYVDFSGADIRGANLTGARINGAEWHGTLVSNGTRIDLGELYQRGWRVVNSKLERIVLPRPHL